MRARAQAERGHVGSHAVGSFVSFVTSGGRASSARAVSLVSFVRHLGGDVIKDAKRLGAQPRGTLGGRPPTHC